MVWVDYKNAYDMIPHLFNEYMIIECMNMFGIAENLTGVRQGKTKQYETMEDETDSW